MAEQNALIRCTPEQVWSVLADGWAYAEWVVGTQQILEVDRDWPAVGSSLQFTAGVPGVRQLQFTDRTFVRVSEPARELQLEAHALPIGTARVSLELIPWDDGTLVLVDEHPLRGTGAILHNFAFDAVLQLRNRRMVTLLVRLVESRFKPVPPDGGGGQPRRNTMTDKRDDLREEARERIEKMPAETALGNRDPEGGGEGNPEDYEEPTSG